MRETELPTFGQILKRQVQRDLDYVQNLPDPCATDDVLNALNGIGTIRHADTGSEPRDPVLLREMVMELVVYAALDVVGAEAQPRPGPRREHLIYDVHDLHSEPLGQRLMVVDVWGSPWPLGEDVENRHVGAISGTCPAPTKPSCGFEDRRPPCLYLPQARVRRAAVRHLPPLKHLAPVPTGRIWYSPDDAGPAHQRSGASTPSGWSANGLRLSPSSWSVATTHAH